MAAKGLGHNLWCRSFHAVLVGVFHRWRFVISCRNPHPRSPIQSTMPCHTPWKNERLEPKHHLFSKGNSSSKPPFLGSMLIFEQAVTEKKRDMFLELTPKPCGRKKQDLSSFSSRSFAKEYPLPKTPWVDSDMWVYCTTWCHYTWTNPAS